MPGPLEGYRIIDVCRAGPGRMATGILADYGADVVSIVEPGYAQRSAPGTGAARASDVMNQRNKRSLFLNFRAEGAREVFLSLAKRSDAVLESNRPGVVKRLGVDYETVKETNPAIVYCSLSGFGQFGPYSGIAAHDIAFQSVAGMLPLDEEEKPMIPTYSQADLNAAYFGAMALIMGLLNRSDKGVGQYIDVAFSDVSLTLPPGGRERDEMLMGKYPGFNTYETRDGRYVSLSIREPWFWDRVCRLLGHEEWSADMRPQGELRDEMFSHFRHFFKTKTLTEWVQILMEHDIEFGPVNSTVEHLWQDPHMRARQMLLETTDPSTGQKQYESGFSMKFAGTPAEKWRGATPMGSDTEAVLTELGYTPEQQAVLRDNGVIA